MSDYFEFKNIFVPHGLHESQVTPSTFSSHVSSPHFTDDTSDNNLSDSSPGYSDSSLNGKSDSEIFESIETTYQVIGVVTRPSIWSNEAGWWVVDITDPEQISKLNKPSLVSISGLFKYDNIKESLCNKSVLVEVTYSEKGYCQWKKNKIVHPI
jgi:hypothetical protein